MNYFVGFTGEAEYLLLPLLKHGRDPMENGRARLIERLVRSEVRGRTRVTESETPGIARLDRARKEVRTRAAAIVIYGRTSKVG